MLLRGHIQMIKGKGKGVARSFLNVEGWLYVTKDEVISTWPLSRYAN